MSSNKPEKIPEDLVLKGTTVTLDPVKPEDYADLCRIMSDPVTMEHLKFLLPEGGYTLEMMEKRCQAQVQSQKDQRSVSFTIHESGGKVIGTCGINGFSAVTGTGSMGLIIDKDSWGKGVSAQCHLLILGYAFEKLGLHRMEFETGTDNKRMQKFLENIGIKLESVKKEAVPRGDGTYSDNRLYVLFEQDWPQVKKALEMKVPEKTPAVKKQTAHRPPAP